MYSESISVLLALRRLQSYFNRGNYNKKKKKKIISFGLLIKNCGNIQLAGKSPKHFLLMCFCSQIPLFHYQISEEPSTPDYYFHFIQPCIKLKNSILTFFLYLLNNHNFLSYMI